MGRPARMHRNCDERDHVQVCVRRGKANARTLTRARVLLKSDEGWTDAQIAEVLDIWEQTIRNIRRRFCAGGVEAVLMGKRPISSRSPAARFLMDMTTGRCAS